MFRFAQLSKDTKKRRRHGGGLEREHLIPVTITEHALLRHEEKGLLAQVETLAVTDITEEAIIALWQSIPRQHQANAVFYMNVVTHTKLLDKFRNSPYHLMSNDRTYGFRLFNKPVVFSNDMPCGNHSNEVLILYGDFGQVEVLQQGTDPVQKHECIAFPGSVEVSMDGYAQVRLLDRQAVKGLRVTEKEGTACRKNPSV